MEVVLHQVWNRLSPFFEGVFTGQYCHTQVVLKHSICWSCTSQRQQLKCHMDGSFLLFYFTNIFSFFLFPCLSFLCITPFSTYLDSPLPEVTSCWAQVSPSDGSTHIIASGDTSATSNGEAFGNKPHGYQWVCEPGAPQGCTANAL